MERRDRWGALGRWGILALVLACLVVAGVALLSLLQPPTADDYSSLAVLRQHPTLPGFVDYWYRSWSGRATGSIVQWAAMHQPSLFAVANGLAFGALVVLTYALAAGRFPRLDRHDALMVSLVLATYWFGLPVPAQTVFWVSGSIPYLWAAVLMLGMAYPYRRWLGGTGSTSSARAAGALSSLGMVALGVAAGLSNELAVAALGALGASFVVAIAGQHRLREVPVHLWAGLFGLFVGGVILALSPGSSARASYGSSGMGLTQIMQFASFLRVALRNDLAGLWRWLLPLVLLGLADRALPADREAARNRWWIVWALTSAVSLSPFIVQPLFAVARVTFFAAVLATVAAVSFLVRQKEGLLIHALPSSLAFGAVAAALVVILAQIGSSVQVSKALRAELSAREAYIEEQIGMGERDIAVPPVLTQQTRTVLYLDISADPHGSYINEAVAEWYDINSIWVDPSLLE